VRKHLEFYTHWFIDVFFIDRDPELFNYILEFLKTGSTDHMPHTDRTKIRQLREEVKFYNINALIELLDPLRYPIESIGEENMVMKQTEDCYRKLFATDRNNPILDDPYLNMVPVFGLRDTFKLEDPPASIPILLNFDVPPPASSTFGGWAARYERRRSLLSVCHKIYDVNF
jgi:hypothetical protein